MSTWTPPDAGDPFVGLTDHSRDGDRPDDCRNGARLLAPLPPSALGHAGLIFLVVVIVAAIFAPLSRPYPPNAQDINAVNAGPSAAHWLGTDDLGRDILSRLISVRASRCGPPSRSSGIAAVVAIPLGLIAGFFRGAVDTVIMRAMDALFSFPPLILALTVAALLGPERQRRLHRHRHRLHPELRAAAPWRGHRRP